MPLTTSVSTPSEASLRRVPVNASSILQQRPFPLSIPIPVKLRPFPAQFLYHRLSNFIRVPDAVLYRAPLYLKTPEDGHEMLKATPRVTTQPERPNAMSCDMIPPANLFGRKVFRCPQCHYTTDRRNNLKRHILTMHKESSKMLECCGIVFSTKASLRQHAMVFHYNGYTCYYCGRRFCRKALLKRHLSVHNGQKDFICTVCDYATSHKSNLERHRKIHSRQDGDQSDDSEHYCASPDMRFVDVAGDDDSDSADALSDDEPLDIDVSS